MAIVFTIREIANHFLNQTIYADADFQIQQRLMWSTIRKEADSLQGATQDLTVNSISGLGDFNQLFVSDIQFAFGLEPVQETLWLRIRRFFSHSFPEPGDLYKFRRNSSTVEGLLTGLQVIITINRLPSGGYLSNIKTSPPLTKRPEETYVSGFS